MKKRSLMHGVLCCMVVLSLGLLSGCGGSDGAQGPAGPAGTSGNNSSDATLPLNGVPSVTENLQAQITSAVVSTTTGSLVVTFKLLDEKGAPLDPRNLITAGGTCRFYVAQIDATGNYKNYILTSVGLPTNDSGSSPSAADAAASTAFAATSEAGIYTFTFNKNITISTDPVYDPALTHTVAAQIGRKIVSSKGVTLQQAVNPFFNFRPDGNAVTVTREVVAISACNECHGTLIGHGSRVEVALCILCHNPGVFDIKTAGKKTGNSLDLKQMVHKIHMGQKLPSNKAASHYTINGHEYTTVKYPSRSGDSFTNNTPINCVKCHKAGTDAKGNAYGANVDAWRTNASIANCTSCHDTTTFDLSTTVTLTSGTTATTLTATPHNGGAQDDTQCTLCHDGTTPASSYSGSYSVPAVHQLPETSTLSSNLTFSITQVEGAISGSTVTVHFTVKDGAGADYTLVGGGGSGTLADSATLLLSYTTGADYDNTAAEWIAAQRYVQAKRKDVSSTSVNPAPFRVGSEYVASFGTVTVPAGSGIGTIALYGKQGVTIPTNQATAHRTAAQHITSIFGAAPYSIYNFNLTTGAPVAAANGRREIVTMAKCNSCHMKLNVHSRPDIKVCILCHAPSLLNTAAEGFSGNLKDMVHSIHGATTSTVIFKGMEPAEYPNDPRNCSVCHISDPMAGLPLPAGTAGSLITATTTTSLTGGTRVLPTQAACGSCHEGAATAAHADANTFGGVESCSVCHSNTSVLGNAHAPVR